MNATLDIAVITLFPDMLDAVTRYGVTGRAAEAGLLRVTSFNPRDYTADRHRTVDDRPFGGGPGMVMKIEPLVGAIAAARQKVDGPVIALSPQGKVVGQRKLAALAEGRRFVLVAGRYEGIDERVMGTLVDEEMSIGDFVLTGGELAAMAIIDAAVRFVPGVLGHESSAEEDSFVHGWLDHPHYTRPERHDLGDVPPILLGGDHQAIARWRLKQALGRTWLRRPDLLRGKSLQKEERQLLTEFIREHLANPDV